MANGLCSIINSCDPSACRLAHLVSCLVLLAVCLFFLLSIFFFFLFSFTLTSSRVPAFSFFLLSFRYRSNYIVLIIDQSFKQINSCQSNTRRQCEFISTPRASVFSLRRNHTRSRSCLSLHLVFCCSLILSFEI